MPVLYLDGVSGGVFASIVKFSSTASTSRTDSVSSRAIGSESSAGSTLSIAIFSTVRSSEMAESGSASRGTIEDRRPENVMLCTVASGIKLSSFSEAISESSIGSATTVAGVALTDRMRLLFKVLGVEIFVIFNVLTFGVAERRTLELPDLLGEPFSATLVGDCGFLAGDCSNDVFKADGVADVCGIDSLNGDPRMAELPSVLPDVDF